MRRRWDGTPSKALQPSLLRVPGSPRSKSSLGAPERKR